MKKDALPRRQFLRGLAAAGAGLAAAERAPGFLQQRDANSRIGVASIGVGTQGYRLLLNAQQVPGVEIRVVCDIYEGNRQRAKRLCTNPAVRFVQEWEKAVQDKDVDAVIVATPDFWHAPMVVAAAEARKDIYVEKGWCTKLADAKRMRKAVKENKVVMQLGHHYNSVAAFHKAREIFKSGALGQLPLVRTCIDRAGPIAEWKFYTDYQIREMPKDAGPDTIDWRRFIANAPKRPFDPERFFTWRRYWDYGTGIAGDLLSHLWDGVNMIVDMGIPETAVTQGGTYFWKDGREVPDMWHVLFDYPKQNLAVTFASSFHNRHVGEIIQLLGRDLTLEVSPAFCRTYGAEWQPEFTKRMAAAREKAPLAGFAPQDAVVPPDYSMKPGELQISTHMADFIDCMRSRGVPRCNEDRAFQEAAALLMSVEAYRRGRRVRWDAAREAIV